MLQADEALLADRRAKGLDRFDEMWAGELHIPPMPGTEHQHVRAELWLTLARIAERLGCEALPAGVFRPGSDDDYRVPDLAISRPAHTSVRGFEGPCELVVEILSPNDETYEKFEFYAQIGVKELLIVEPESRKVELYVLRAGSYVLMSPDEKGTVRSSALGVGFATVAGPKIAVTWSEGRAEV
jgi:Uma2 family endonuclease